MYKWHRRFMYLQILILLVLAFLEWRFPDLRIYSWVGVGIFVFLQVAIQGAKAYENPLAVYYRRSCVVALLDFFSMYVFVALLSYRAFGAFVEGWVFILLFLYIAFRKFYIIRNYSYIK